MPRQRKASQAPAQCSTDPSTAAATAPPSLPHLSTPPPADSLPLELLPLVFSSLHASDVGRAACVHPAWHSIISREARTWTLAMAELDPFCALDGAQGASRLFRSVGGCWLRTAAVLAAMGGRGAGCCEKPGSLMLCRCPPPKVTRAAAAAATVAATATAGLWWCMVMRVLPAPAPCCSPSTQHPPTPPTTSTESSGSQLVRSWPCCLPSVSWVTVRP